MAPSSSSLQSQQPAASTPGASAEQAPAEHSGSPKTAAPRFERVAVLIGITTCLLSFAVGLALYLVEFRVDLRIVNAALGGVVIAAAITFYGARPPASLTPTERMIRSRRIEFGVMGLTIGAAILGSIAAAAELDTARDWFMLAVIASSPIGVHFLVNTRFGMA